MNTLSILLPEVLLLLLGYQLRKRSGWHEEFWVSIEKLVYFFLFPALLFVTIINTKSAFSTSLPAVSVAVLASCATIALAFLTPWLFKPDPLRFASAAQIAFRFNSYVALALAQRIGGESGLALCAMVVGVVVPLYNTMAVLPMARHAGSGIGGTLLAIAKNPLVLATSLGLIGNIAGITLPAPIDITLSRLGSGALVLGLLAVGAGISLELKLPRNDFGMGIWLLAIKSIVMPLAVWWLCIQFDIKGTDRSVLMAYSAVPTASSCYILASRMGGDGAYVAVLTSLSVLVSAVTLPFWLSVI